MAKATAPAAMTPDDQDGGSDIVVVSDSTLRIEIDGQIATAKKYPRNIQRAMDQAKSMAMMNEDIAASCCYSVPRAGKTIMGPSIRLAEIVASAWGNLRLEKRPGLIEHDFVEAEGVCWDLETNTAIRIKKKRRITDSHGRRYSDDMIVNTINAAGSICLRDALIAVIPRAFVRTVYDAAYDLAMGTIESLGARRTKALEWYARYGVTAEKICLRMGRASIEELTLADIASLKSLGEDIKRGEITMDEAFAAPREDDGGGDGEPADATSLAAAAKQQVGKTDKDRQALLRKQAADMKAKQDDEAKAKAGAAPAPAASDATGTPVEQPAAPAASDEADLEKRLKRTHCSPGKDGCESGGTTLKIGKTSKYVCALHDPRNTGSPPNA